MQHSRKPTHSVGWTLRTESVGWEGVGGSEGVGWWVGGGGQPTALPPPACGAPAPRPSLFTTAGCPCTSNSAGTPGPTLLLRVLLDHHRAPSRDHSLGNRWLAPAPPAAVVSLAYLRCCASIRCTCCRGMFAFSPTPCRGQLFFLLFVCCHAPPPPLSRFSCSLVLSSAWEG